MDGLIEISHRTLAEKLKKDYKSKCHEKRMCYGKLMGMENGFPYELIQIGFHRCLATSSEIPSNSNLMDTVNCYTTFSIFTKKERYIRHSYALSIAN